MRVRPDSLAWRALRPDAGNLGRRVVHGIAWQYGLVITRVALTLLSTAILARLLLPSDYGLVAMAALVTELAALFGNVGLGQVLVQKRKLFRIDLDTAFWASLGVAGVLMLGLAIAAYPASLLLRNEDLVGVLLVSSLSFLFNGLTVVPAAVLNRLMLFKTDALIQIGQLVVRALVAIALAAGGYGYWSLVIAGLAASLFGAIAELAVVRYLPRLRFSRGFVRNYLGAGGSYLGSGLLSYVMANIDYFVVGRRFGTEQLGYYQVAYTLPDELRNRVSVPLQRVLFPAYALLQTDLPQLRRAAFRSQRALSLVVLPLGAVLCLSAADVVAVLYGPRWAPVVPLLQVLAMGGALRALFGLVGNIFFATGRPDLALKLNLVSFPLVIAAVLLGSVWGTLGVAWAMVLVNVFSLYSASRALSLIGASLVDFLRACAPAAAATLAVAAAVLLVRPAVGIGPGVAGLLVTGFIASGTFLLALFWLDRPLLTQIVSGGRTVCGRLLAGLRR